MHAFKPLPTYKKEMVLMTAKVEECIVQAFCGKTPGSYKLGTPICFENLAVIPLCLKKQGKTLYLTYQEAQEKDLLTS